MFQYVGRLMLLTGLVLAGVGALMVLLGRAGLGRLPGDLSFGGKGWWLFVPITTSLALSAVLTLLVYLLARLRR
jgi:hypothetical protein